MTHRIDLDRIDLMTDIETWGTGPDAVVRAVAMVAFKPWTGEVVATMAWDWRRLVDEQIELGCTVDADTVRWWKNRCGGSLGDMLQGCGSPFPVAKPNSLDDALSQIESVIIDHDISCFWSRGAFDYPILSNLFGEMVIGECWKFWQLRDVRTLDDLAPKVKPDHPHHPLSDCLAQVEQVRAALALVPREEAA